MISRLKAYKERIGEEEEEQDDQGKLMYANTESRQPYQENYGSGRGRGRVGRSNWRGRGHRRFGYYQNGYVRDESKVMCYRCETLGHYASICPDRLLKLQEVVEKRKKTRKRLII